jgi:hypothetical protein
MIVVPRESGATVNRLRSARESYAGFSVFFSGPQNHVSYAGVFSAGTEHQALRTQPASCGTDS